MKKYEVNVTAIYNGIVTIYANSENDAINMVQDQLYGKNLDGLPDYVDLPIGESGHLSFGEATADYADAVEYQDGNSVDFLEVRIDHFDEICGCWKVDVWYTDNDDEEGDVVAEIYPANDYEVVYLADWAKTNTAIKDKIADTINWLKTYQD